MPGAAYAANQYFRRAFTPVANAVAAFNNLARPADAIASVPFVTELWNVLALAPTAGQMDTETAVTNLNATINFCAPPSADAVLADALNKAVLVPTLLDGGPTNPEATPAGQVAALRAAVGAAAAPAYGGDAVNDSLATLLEWIAVTHGLA